MCKVNLAWASTYQQVVATHWLSSKSMLQFARKWTLKFLISYTIVTLNEGQGHSNWYVELSGPYHHIKFERISWQMSEYKPMLIFFQQNHISRILSLDCCTDKIEWVWGRAYHQLSIVYQIHSNPLKILWDDWHRSFCFLALLWSWITVRLN